MRNAGLARHIENFNFSLQLLLANFPLKGKSP